MALTRPTFNNINSNVLAKFDDPLVVLNAANTSPNNQDIGFIVNRGISGNVAIAWEETVDSFVLVYTNSSGQVNGNINVTGNANLRVGNLTAVGTTTFIGNMSVGHILPAANVTYDLGSPTQRFRTLYIAGNTIDMGGATISANATSIVFTNPSGGTFEVSGSSSALSGASLTTTGDATIGGNLTVNGTTVTVNATTVTTNDKNIVVANNQSTSAGIDGAGVDAGGGNSPVATWRYNHSTTSWQSNVGITPSANNSVALGGANNWWNNAYATNIYGTLQTASQTNITGVGNITTGTWSGTTIATNRGGTGLTSFTSGGAVYASSSSVLTTGTLPVASGGTGVTTSTGSGSVVLSAGPTLTGTLTAATINAATIGNSGTTLTGTIQTASQPNITSVGTLTGLALTGTLTGTTVNAATVGNTGTVITGSSVNAATIGNTGTTLVSTTANVSGNATVVGNLTAGNVFANRYFYANGVVYGGGGGGTPGGSTGQIQYNDNGVFAGASGLTTNGSNLTVIAGIQNTPIGNVTANTGAFTTLSATGTFTGTVINAATIGNAGSTLTGSIQTASQTNITGIGNITTGTWSATPIGLAYGGTGATTAQAGINALAGSVTSGQYLRGNGTNVVMSAIQAADVPTLNQNTTGSAGSVTNALTINNGGAGSASGSTYNGSAAVTISHNTIGAAPQAGNSSIVTVGNITSGTWSATLGAVSAANLTNIPAGQLTGTIPSTVLGNSTVYVGTTAVALNRASASLNLTGVNIDGQAGTVANGVYTTGSYSDPTWLTISKSKVGLSNVENTALSTWAGSTNITTIGAATASSLSVTGNLTVNGTTTTINSTTVTLDDPILTLGGDTAPTVDDNKDRGIEFRWHNGTAAKVGFFGFDDSTGYLTFIPDATNTSEVFSGTAGDIQASNFRGALVGNADTATKLATARTIALTGDVTGSGTFDGSGNLSIAATIAADSVALGTDTTGNYVASVATTAPLSGGAVGSEGGALTLSLASGYGDTQNPYASKTANYFLAAPNGTAGAPTFRAIVAADVPTLNQNTTGSAGSVANALTFNNAGTGSASGSTYNGSAAVTISHNTIGAAPQAGNSSIVTVGTISSGTWNGNAIGIAYGGTGQTTAQSALNALAGNTTTSGSYLRGNGTAIVMSAIQASDIPTLNQNTTGTAGAVTNALTLSNGGAGAASGSTYYGNAAVTISHNSIGAAPQAGNASIVTVGNITSGTWSATAVGLAYGGTGASTAATARTNLGLAIGTDVQAYNATLATVAAGTYTGSTSIVTLGNITTGTWNGTAIATAKLAASTISGVTLGSNLNTLTLGSYLTGTSYNGSAAVTAAVDATTAATASKIVARDANGDINSRYCNATYLNSSDDVNTGSVTYLMAKFGDNYLRSASAAKVATFLSGQTMNIAGTASSETLATVTSRGAQATGSISVATGEGYGYVFWNDATNYKIHMGSTAGTYQYGPVTDYSMRFTMGSGTGRGFTWGYAGSAPIAALNAYTGNMQIAGTFSAASKSFLIPHPTKPGMQLRYGSLEGPENGVYVRGKLTGNNTIELPEYWAKLVDPESITVNLTPIGKHQNLFVESVSINRVVVGNSNLFGKDIDCFFVVYGERIDIDKLVVEE